MNLIVPAKNVNIMSNQQKGGLSVANPTVGKSGDVTRQFNSIQFTLLQTHLQDRGP